MQPSGFEDSIASVTLEWAREFAAAVDETEPAPEAISRIGSRVTRALARARITREASRCESVPCAVASSEPVAVFRSNAALLAAQRTVPMYLWARKVQRLVQEVSGAELGRATPASWATLVRLGAPEEPPALSDRTSARRFAATSGASTRGARKRPRCDEGGGEAVPAPCAVGGTSAMVLRGKQALVSALSALAELYGSQTSDAARDHRIRVTRRAIARIQRSNGELALLADAPALSSRERQQWQARNRRVLLAAGLPEGSHTLAKAEEILATGKLAQIEAMVASTPGSRDLQRLWGLGPHRAALLAHRLGQWEAQLEELRTASHGRALESPSQADSRRANVLAAGCKLANGVPRLRFALENAAVVFPEGVPVHPSTVVYLEHVHDLGLRLPREEIAEWVGLARAVARRAFGATAMLTCCGSYRRFKRDSGDIDLLLSHPQAVGQASLLGTRDFLRRLVASGHFEIKSLARQDAEDFTGPARQPKATVGGAIRRPGAAASSAAEAAGSSRVGETLFCVARLRRCPAYVSDVLLQGVRVAAREALVRAGLRLANPAADLEARVAEAMPRVRALCQAHGALVQEATSSFQRADADAAEQGLPPVRCGAGALAEDVLAKCRLLETRLGALAAAPECHSTRCSGLAVLARALMPPPGRSQGILSGRGLELVLERICSFLLGPWRRLDLKSYSTPAFATALLYFTGSAHFNRSMRYHAGKSGFSLCDKALTPAIRMSGSQAGKRNKVLRGGPVAVRTERQIFDVLGLAWVPPEWRDPALAADV